MADIVWLTKLQEKLWPPEQQKKGGAMTRHGWVQLKLEAKRKLKKREWQRVLRAIDKDRLIVELIGTNMFGGVGIRIYDHPPVPGIDTADLILTLTQDHVFGDQGPTGGSCFLEAHDTFFALADTDDNRRWCEMFKLDLPREASAYDY